MKKLTLKIGSQLRIKNLPHYLIPELRNHLIMENPLHAENEKHGHSNFKTPKKLRFISEDSKTMPKGFLSPLKALLKEKKIDYRVIHCTESHQCEPVLKSKISFKERPYGAVAVEKIMKKRFGVLQAPTGSGKTVIAIETIVRRNECTVITVHTKELLYQWRDRLIQFTNLEKADIGLVGDGHKSIKNVTVGVVNSLKKLTSKELAFFGYVILDECHRVPSTTFTEFLVKLNTKYMLGLSATPYRRDKLDKVINFFVGEVVYIIKTKKLQEEGHIMKADLKIIKTSFSPYVHSVYSYSKIIKALTEDEDRNNLIIQNVLKQAKKDDGIILVISDRVQHCFSLQLELISEGDFPTCLLTGKSSKRERMLAVQTLNENKGARILIATGQLIGEGFDLKQISSIFLTTPIKWEGRLIQYCGRILRTAEGKEKATIFDMDDPCWLLKGSFGKRMKIYREMGIDNV